MTGEPLAEAVLVFEPLFPDRLPLDPEPVPERERDWEDVFDDSEKLGLAELCEDTEDWLCEDESLDCEGLPLDFEDEKPDCDELLVELRDELIDWLTDEYSLLEP